MSNTNEPVTTDDLFSRTQQNRKLFLNRQLLAAGCAIIFALLILFKAFNSAETAFLDFWLSRSQPQQSSQVALVAISAKSLKQIGSWPWPPFRHAVMIEFLQRLGVRSIYIDHTFAENGWEEEQEALNAVLKKKTIPIFFAADYLPKFENSGPGLEKIMGEGDARMQWVRPTMKIAEHTFLGHRKISPGGDRVFRMWQPWVEGQGKAYPLVALKMIHELPGDVKTQKYFESQRNKEKLIPWNQDQFSNWPRFEFSSLVQSYLSIREGVSPNLDLDRLKGKDVFIGLADEASTLSGLTPWKQTTFSFEVMAMIFDGLSQKKLATSVVASPWVSWGFFGLFSGAFIFWTGIRLGRIYWLGGLGLLLALTLVWFTGIFLSYWISLFSSAFYLVIAAGLVFIFDALHSKQERSALFHLATRDGLTNLYVIRHFRVIMNQMTREAVMRKESLAVILMDIDHFKKINDTYGHPAGDMVLKKAAAVIQGAVRQKRTLKDIDFVARYGGEEFIVLIRRNSIESVSSRIAERIRKAIESTDFDWNGTKISVTMSLGVAMLGEGENVPDPMVHRADKALYLAKESGRNQVCTQNDTPSH